MHTTNVDNTTTEWSYCLDELGEHNISIAAVNNVGEGDIMTLALLYNGKYQFTYCIIPICVHCTASIDKIWVDKERVKDGWKITISLKVNQLVS